MSKNRKKCTVFTKDGMIKGEIIKEYEEIGGADDGATFAIIKLQNGQLLTVKMSEISRE